MRIVSIIISNLANKTQCPARLEVIWGSYHNSICRQPIPWIQGRNNRCLTVRFRTARTRATTSNLKLILPAKMDQEALEIVQRLLTREWSKFLSLSRTHSTTGGANLLMHEYNKVHDQQVMDRVRWEVFCRNKTPLATAIWRLVKLWTALGRVFTDNLLI